MSDCDNTRCEICDDTPASKVKDIMLSQILGKVTYIYLCLKCFRERHGE